MQDPYLDALMHGEISKEKQVKSAEKITEKNCFDIALEKNIQKLLNIENLENEPVQNLLSPGLKQKQMETEVRNSFKFTELNTHIETALTALLTDGHRYLEDAEYNTLIDHLAKASGHLNQLDLEKPITEQFDTILGFDENTMNAIFKVAVSKYEEEQYSTSLAIFVLLTTLQTEDFDYWYRTGISAQQCEDYALALKSYAKAAALNPNYIGARLFSTECHLKLNEQNEAEAEFEEAKKIKEALSLKDKWAEIFDYVGSLVKR